MARGKLILICQSGGDFVKNDDGSLKYAGGEAQAVNVNCETLFDDLKLKLAEMWNLKYETVAIKYFLPGNTQTLITLSNDKGLKRMLDFHGNSVTADVFVTGIEGFNREPLSTRETCVKAAESVNRVVAPTAAASNYDGPADHVVAGGTAAPKKATRATTDSVKGVDATSKSPTRATSASNTSTDADSDNSSDFPFSPVSVAAKETGDSPTVIDMSATPADTVKKRRRTASWKLGVNGPTIVSVPDDAGDQGSRKRSCRSLVAYDDIRQQKEVAPLIDDLDTCLVTNSDDLSAEKLVASWKDGISGIGQEFKNVTEFREALQKYAIANRFGYKLKKNDSNRVSGVCVTEGCSWKIHATRLPSAQSFRIKKFDSLHTCEGDSRKSPHPTKNWLVNLIKEKVGDSSCKKPKEVANAILRDFGIELKYTQVWRGMEDAKEQLRGSYKGAYNQLLWFHEKIMETNPGSFAKLVVDDEKRFRCLFISFHASIHGFQKGCRPLLFLDATSLRSRYQEVLLTATALDGDDGFFPVAFAIVHVENDDTWQWFLEQLKSALPSSGSITFVSDREKGLKESVLKKFENAYNGYSIYHLLESFKKSLKGPFLGDGRGSLLGNFVAAAHAVRPVGFKKFTEQMKQVSSQAYDWVMQIEPECWTVASFKGERYNHITKNVAEAYIKVMEEARESTITQKIERLICTMSEFINTRRTDSSEWSTKLTPSKMEKLHEEIVDARTLKALISSETLFEVPDDVNHVVNLNKSECTCLGWQTTGLPCRHAIAVFNRTHRSVYDYCSRYFTVDSFCLTYSESIIPVPCVGIGKPGEKVVSVLGVDKTVEKEVTVPGVDKPVEKEETMQGVDKTVVEEETLPEVDKPVEEEETLPDVDERVEGEETLPDVDKPVENEGTVPGFDKPVVEEDTVQDVDKPVEEETVPNVYEPIEIDETMPGVDKPVVVEVEILPDVDKPVEEETLPDVHKPVENKKIIQGVDKSVEGQETLPDVDKPVKGEETLPDVDKPVEEEGTLPNVDKPVEKEEIASETVFVLPPCHPRSRSPTEVETKQAKIKGPPKRVVYCSRCKEAGHNKASCKATL